MHYSTLVYDKFPIFKIRQNSTKENFATKKTGELPVFLLWRTLRDSLIVDTHISSTRRLSRLATGNSSLYRDYLRVQIPPYIAIYYIKKRTQTSAFFDMAECVLHSLNS